MSLTGRNSTILVSGAGGFLGRELVKQLLDSKKFKVIALTSQKKDLIEEFGNSPDFEVLCSNNYINELNSDLKIDVLVNCAFPRSSDPEKLAKGLLYTETLIKNSLNLNIKKIINISSQSVYSQKTKDAADEEAPVIPESSYGMTKYASERIVSSACNLNKLVSYSNIRLASLSGFGLEVRMTNRFVKNSLDGQPIIIYGGNQSVSYLDVRDASSALIAMINSDSNLWKSVYNLGNYDFCTVLQLAEMVRDMAYENSIAKVKIELQTGENSFSNLLNSNLFYNDFQWRPHYTMSLIVKDLFKYYTGKL